MNEQKALKTGFSFGTKAIDTYDNCCKLIGFKNSYRGSFAAQKPLYAKNASREGYSVWMLAHSNLNETLQQAKECGRRWFNIFIDHEDTIKEIWFEPSEYIADNSIRITFAKNSNGIYVFKGVYKPIAAQFETSPYGKTEWSRTFQRISNVYPMMNEVPQIGFKGGTVSEINEPLEISTVIDKCKIKARILETNKETSVKVDVSLRPFQKSLIGKKKGDRFTLPNVKLTYEIFKILASEKQGE